MAYELGTRISFPKLTGAIAWKDTKSIEGVIAYARDERTAEYVRVYDVEAHSYVQGIAQGFDRGNFDNVEAARRKALQAYRWLNKGRR